MSGMDEAVSNLREFNANMAKASDALGERASAAEAEGNAVDELTSEGVPVVVVTADNKAAEALELALRSGCELTGAIEDACMEGRADHVATLCDRLEPSMETALAHLRALQL